MGLKSDPRPALKHSVFAKSTLKIFVIGELANFGDKATLVLVLTGWAVTCLAQGEYCVMSLLPCGFFFYLKGLEIVPWPQKAEELHGY